MIFGQHLCLPIYILLWGHSIGDLLCVYFVDGVQRQLHDEAVDRRVFIHLFYTVKNLNQDRQRQTDFIHGMYCTAQSVLWYQCDHSILLSLWTL